MNNQYFISYSSKDVDITFKLVNYLESNGIKCWVAPRNISSGLDYTDCIDDAIKNCDGIILLFSSHSAQSIWVKKELALALGYHKSVIPFKLTDVAVDGGFNFMLNNVQWIDASSRPESKFPMVLAGLQNNDFSTPVNPPTSSASHKRRLMLFSIVGVVLFIAVVVLLVVQASNPSSNPTADPSTDTTITTLKSEVTVSKDDIAIQNSTSQKANSVVAKDKNKDATAHKYAAEQKAVSESEVKSEPTPEAKETPTLTKSDKRYSKAVNLYNAHLFREALPIFETLKREGNTSPDIDNYIASCKEKLSK